MRNLSRSIWSFNQVKNNPKTALLFTVLSFLPQSWVRAIAVVLWGLIMLIGFLFWASTSWLVIMGQPLTVIGLLTFLAGMYLDKKYVAFLLSPLLTIGILGYYGYNSETTIKSKEFYLSHTFPSTLNNVDSVTMTIESYAKVKSYDERNLNWTYKFKNFEASDFKMLNSEMKVKTASSPKVDTENMTITEKYYYYPKVNITEGEKHLYVTGHYPLVAKVVYHGKKGLKVTDVEGRYKDNKRAMRVFNEQIKPSDCKVAEYNKTKSL